MGVLVGEKREGSISVRRSGGRNVVEAEYLYLVQGTSKTEGRASITSTPGLPLVGITQSLTTGMCVAKTASRDPVQPLYWSVSCIFSTEVSEYVDPSTPVGVGDPVTWTPIAELQLERYEEVFHYDANGKRYQNSANQRLPDGITIPRTVCRWQFFQFERLPLTYQQIADRNDTVNSSVIYGCPVKCLLCNVDRASLGNYYGHRCWLIEYSLRYKPEVTIYNNGIVDRRAGGWQTLVKDEGDKVWAGGVKQANGNFTGGTLVDYDLASPGFIGPMNGLGRAVDSGGVAYLLSFDKYVSSDFSFIRLLQLS